MHWRRGLGSQSTQQDRQYQYEEVHYTVARVGWCTRTYVSRTKGYGLICYGGAVVCCAPPGVAVCGSDWSLAAEDGCQGQRRILQER